MGGIVMTNDGNSILREVGIFLKYYTFDIYIQYNILFSALRYYKFIKMFVITFYCKTYTQYIILTQKLFVDYLSNIFPFCNTNV